MGEVRSLNDTWTFRTAGAEDATILGQVAVAAKSHWGYPPEWIELWRRDLEPTPEDIERDHFVLCEQESEVLGFVSISNRAGEPPELEGLWVRPEWMRRGIGRALLLKTVDWCRDQGIGELMIISDPNARPFYEAQGAVLVGSRPSVPFPRDLPVLRLDVGSALLERPGSGAGEVAPVVVREITAQDRGWVREFLLREAGALRMVSRGRLHQVDELPGFLATWEGRPQAVLTYRSGGDEIEVVTLHSAVRGRGLGTRLLETLRQKAAAVGCRRVWLITTNDNEPAIDFYKNREMTLVALHRGAIRRARELKPEIPLYGLGGEPIEDELEFEYLLDS